MKKALIIGATGFGGLGLIDILAKHPEIEIAEISAIDYGKKISNMYPHLCGICDLEVKSPDNIEIDAADIVFLATPDQVGMKLVKKFYDKKIPVIDFSGDFRFQNLSDYKKYAGNKNMDENHSSPELLSESVYGLPEVNFDKISAAPIIGNPGCFAMAMILGLIPAIKNSLIKNGTIICDGKTGVSGAGINPGKENSYPLRYENSNTYKEGKHQHLVEVENLINSINNKNSGDHKIFFVPQIVPMNRGILMTIYAESNREIDTERLSGIYREYYQNSPFINILDSSPNTSEVRGTNRCNIKVFSDKRTGKILIVSALDNLVKGQSGNAVQNANIRLGLDQTIGLNLSTIYP
ncbi:MAG: N-acetyl-gamma-glutamyl-phosphate reductase [Leptospirales bacterium]|nr:N-acetyl-gamma-glutamyl-phosphate reductase [Leptospirales bacterium]